MRGWALALGLFPAVAGAALRSAAWGTDPSAPVYVGQSYMLTLTLETGKGEEITRFATDQGPKEAPESQSVRETKDARFTTFCWPQTAGTARLVALPAGWLSAELAVVQQFGAFGRMVQTRQEQTALPAFSYEVQELDGEAAGALIGSFTMELAADAATFASGDVRILTATLEAREGAVPESYPFALVEGSPGRCYPFRTVERTRKRLTAQAYYVTEGEASLSLALTPLRVFDVSSRSVTELSAEPLVLQMHAAEEAAAEMVTLGATASAGEPLRFAPRAGSPVLGALERSSPRTVLERRPGWVRVCCEDGRTGWMREQALDGEPSGTPGDEEF